MTDASRPDASMPAADGLLLDVGVVFFKSAWEIADEYEARRGLPAGTVVGRSPRPGWGPPLAALPGR
jgi:hypothetical protein